MRTILAAATLLGGVALAQAAPADAKTVKIGLSMLTQTAPYYVALQDAVQKQAKALGATVVTADANGDMLKQISDVEDMLSQKIDVLVMDPKDAKGLVGVTREAAKDHVPVIIVDSSIDPSAPVLTTIQSSNSENGRLIGDWLIGKVKNMDLRIALLSGDQGN
ncbi:MAG: substrate-binding domain-containing protein, partial [Gluconacetobacter diazotrophicus]|nr:substrate-binding domain-containing protein [Gluconacetobacter diazotrophicus]